MPDLIPTTPPIEPARWHEGMRKSPPYALADVPPICWRYLSEKTVCILERGHDDGVHEPILVPDSTPEK